jgi:CDP-diacylglycerol--glycerol-3-phosphate 3-phosphatidyltransferase
MTPSGYFLALILFFVAAITDYFDGYFARKFNAVSQFGEVLDPIADKILIVFVLFGLSISLSSYLIGFIAAMIISREIWVGALRDLNARKGKSELTKVTFLAKIKTTVQLSTITIYLFGLSINNMFILIIGDIFLFITFFITIYTGYIYTISSFEDKAQ